jgi:hypothetical protein
LARTSGGTGIISPPSILSFISYAPASPVNYTLTASLAGLDTTHLTIGFTTTSFTTILIQAWITGVLSEPLVAGNSTSIALAFVTHSTSTQVSAVQSFLGTTAQVVAVHATAQSVCAYAAVVSGLTANTSYNWDLAGAYVGTAPTTGQMTVDNGSSVSSFGQATIVVSTI